MSGPKRTRHPSSLEDSLSGRKGLLRREPTIDFRPSTGVIADGTLDPEVLAIAADDDRVLISGDLRTMSLHFQDFVSTRESPGVLLIPSSRSIGAAIEGLLYVWLHWSPEGLRNRISWLP